MSRRESHCNAHRVVCRLKFFSHLFCLALGGVRCQERKGATPKGAGALLSSTEWVDGLCALVWLIANFRPAKCEPDRNAWAGAGILPSTTLVWSKHLNYSYQTNQITHAEFPDSESPLKLASGILYTGGLDSLVAGCGGITDSYMVTY
ncbi:hypothetical protein BJX64DRAFT_30459 [Aspergillus heterothallicus]